jgi:hypothetical protein
MKHSILLTSLLLLSGSLVACGSDGGGEGNGDDGGTGGMSSGGTGGNLPVGGGGTTGGTGGSDGGAGGSTDGGAGGVTAEFCDAPMMVFLKEDTAGGCLGASCHVSANIEAFPPDLEAADPAMRLYDLASSGAYCTGGEDPGKYINPDDVEASLLITKISSTPVCGVQMPFALDPIPEADADCIRKWVRWVVANH